MNVSFTTKYLLKIKGKFNKLYYLDHIYLAEVKCMDILIVPGIGV